MSHSARDPSQRDGIDDKANAACGRHHGMTECTHLSEASRMSHSARDPSQRDGIDDKANAACGRHRSSSDSIVLPEAA